tara:strand:+ start:7138 stop:7707 length:570 start_codon:yes stop_codon:yes gene_type:complete
MDNIRIVLGSKSPRRQELIKKLGFPFEIRTKEVQENYPDTIPKNEVATFLAQLKAVPLIETLNENEVLLTSDTVVIHNNEILGKPKDEQDSFRMLRLLSDDVHEVITGVYLSNKTKNSTFATTTKVFFSELSDQEIGYYITNYKPFDKAGSYGIQEWIGMIGIYKIEGCFYNVMGLPVHDVYRRLKEFI